MLELLVTLFEVISCRILSSVVEKVPILSVADFIWLGLGTIYSSIILSNSRINPSLSSKDFKLFSSISP